MLKLKSREFYNFYSKFTMINSSQWIRNDFWKDWKLWFSNSWLRITNTTRYSSIRDRTFSRWLRMILCIRNFHTTRCRYFRRQGKNNLKLYCRQINSNRFTRRSLHKSLGNKIVNSKFFKLKIKRLCTRRLETLSLGPG